MTDFAPANVEGVKDRPIILVVDDEVRSQETLRRVLEEEFEVVTVSSAAEAEAVLESEMVHAILCDQRMPGTTGVAFLRDVRTRWPDPVRMIISGYTDAEDIIKGVNEAGIYQYITKPWVPDDLLTTIRDALTLFDLQQDNQSASVEMKQAVAPVQKSLSDKKKKLKEHFDFSNILYVDGSPMEETCLQAAKVARLDISVLLMGESGTGKELVARAIHYNSDRADKAFIVENCGALPDELLESELFGCKKGAFTGAYEDRIGLFEKAHGGTIFLDEIGETSPAFQVKLLRVLQEGEFRPLGSQLTRKVDVRVISATNRNLEEEVHAGRFRQDLYYRLSAFPIHLPSLKERPGDIALIAKRALKGTTRAFNVSDKEFSKECLEALVAYHWPGNVRELQNEIQRLVALSDDGLIGAGHLSRRVTDPDWNVTDGKHEGLNAQPGKSLKEQVETLERLIIDEAMKRHHGNISRASDELDLSRVGLRAKLKRYGMVTKDSDE